MPEITRPATRKSWTLRLPRFGVPSSGAKPAAGNIPVDGFKMTLRHWPCVVWSYAISLAFGFLSGLPFSAGIAPYLDHSLASQQISGSLDAGYLGELAYRFHRDHGVYASSETALWLMIFEFFATLVIVAGTVPIYLSGEPATLSVLLRRGSQYFWRFVRVALFGAITAGPILGGLLALRAALVKHASESVFERRLFVYSAISALVILLAAVPLRLWLDLVEVYTVRNGMGGERRVRRALLPALRLLVNYFLGLFSSFVLAGLAGLVALTACLYLWKDLVPSNQIWLACLLSQSGIFLFLASRFWQRGMEASLVLAVEPPVQAVAEPLEQIVAAPAPLPPAEPTLQDLVMKLKKEPWARPDPVPVNSALFPEAETSPRTPEARPAQDELLAEHERKAPLPSRLPVKASFSPKTRATSETAPENQLPNQAPNRDGGPK